MSSWRHSKLLPHRWIKLYCYIWQGVQSGRTILMCIHTTGWNSNWENGAQLMVQYVGFPWNGTQWYTILVSHEMVHNGTLFWFPMKWYNDTLVWFPTKWYTIVNGTVGFLWNGTHYVGFPWKWYTMINYFGFPWVTSIKCQADFS